MVRKKLAVVVAALGTMHAGMVSALGLGDFSLHSALNQPFDAEAFGQGNTRSRPWLTDSVWLTLALRDRGIALAHELFHILANSGEHSTAAGNLMLGRTTGKNHQLQQSQCEVIRTRLAAR